VHPLVMNILARNFLPQTKSVGKDGLALESIRFAIALRYSSSLQMASPTICTWRQTIGVFAVTLSPTGSLF